MAVDRVEFLDVLRGFALIGVCAANLFIFSGYSYMDDAQRAALGSAAADRVALSLELVFIETKFMGLFSFLFGASFWFFLDRARARGLGGNALFYRRLGWLFVIGAIHGWLLWCFDILRFYALWGLLLPLCLRASQRQVLGLALLFAVVLPATVNGVRAEWFGPGGESPDALALQAFSSGGYLDMLRVNWIYDWYLTLSVGQISYQVAIFGRMLLGLYAARALLFTAPQRHAALLRRIAAIGIVVGVAGNLVTANHVLDPGDAGGFAAGFAACLVEESGYLALTLTYAAGLALLFQLPRWSGGLRVLAPIGQMALTCYLLQTVFALWLFYGFMPGPQLMGRVGPALLLGLCAASFVLQAGFAALWLRRFRFGPAEWLWRSLTYWKLQPFFRAAPAAA
jgi:uncharacterized protein